MIKKILLISSFILLIGLLVFGAVNRTLAKTGSESNEGKNSGWRSGSEEQTIPKAGGAVGGEQSRGGQGNGYGNGSGSEASSEEHNEFAWSGDPGSLTESEIEALQFMREEEKLARDVYQALYETWQIRAFQNISNSEQTHMDAIKTLLDRYSITDPASNQAGIFKNADLQALYDQLVVRGQQSVEKALKVGALIEETDINDLQTRLAQVTNPEVQQVFESLLAGSYNHLRAFARQIENRSGTAYQPVVLSQVDYEAIIGSSPTGQGYGGQGAGRGQGGSQGQGQGRQP
jgi:hypothetical protein